jgi:hypothetical protein
MDIDLTTPALFFPAISLMMLAYTSRFLALAALIRALHVRNREHPDDAVIAQIGNLRNRVQLVRNMQAFGASSMLLCVICMFVLFAGYIEAGKVIFAISMILLIISLALSLREIQISVNALNLHLKDLEKGK